MGNLGDFVARGPRGLIGKVRSVYLNRYTVQHNIL